jgi:hypothetical protein
MIERIPTETEDREYNEAQKRVEKIKKFYKNLASWAGTSIFMIALDFFLSGGITWSKYPVFFWGITILIDVFQIIRLQRMDKNWEERQIRRFTGRNYQPRNTSTTELPAHQQEDYSDELLNQQEREMADLKEYRQLKKPWEDKDLV